MTEKLKRRFHLNDSGPMVAGRYGHLVLKVHLLKINLIGRVQSLREFVAYVLLWRKCRMHDETPRFSLTSGMTIQVGSAIWFDLMSGQRIGHHT